MNSSPRPLVATALLVLAGAARADVEVEGTLGSLDDSVVQAAVTRHAAALRACYDGNAGNHYVGGHVTIVAKVSLAGQVSATHVAEGDLGAWAVEKCLVGVVAKMDFGKPTGGVAEVRVPLDFSAASAPAASDDETNSATVKQLARCGKAGETDLTLYVGVGGAVMQVGFAGEVTTAWADCADKIARGWKLPDPRGRVVKAHWHYTPPMRITAK